MVYEIQEQQSGLFTMMLGVCSVMVLEHILDRQVPYVWVEGHSPMSTVGWWRTPVPLNTKGISRSLKIRNLQYDLQMLTKEFLELLSDFQDEGIWLAQSHNQVPDTLITTNIDVQKRHQVFVQNGVHLWFLLPHAQECASITSPYRHVLEKIRANPVIASGKLP